MVKDSYPRGLIERLENLRDQTHDGWTTKGQLWFEVMDIIQWVNGQQIESLTRELRLERIERGLP